MESDEAMALLFNISAIQLRCSLPEHVSRVNIPLKSVVMLADSDTVALNAALSTSEENSVIKYGGISNATHARLREELLLLIEVRSVPSCAAFCGYVCAADEQHESSVDIESNSSKLLYPCGH